MQNVGICDILFFMLILQRKNIIFCARLYWGVIVHRLFMFRALVAQTR